MHEILYKMAKNSLYLQQIAFEKYNQFSKETIFRQQNRLANLLSKNSIIYSHK